MWNSKPQGSEKRSVRGSVPVSSRPLEKENCVFKPSAFSTSRKASGRGARSGLVKAAQAARTGAKYALLNTLEMTAARNGAGKEPSIRRNKAPEFRAHLSAP